MSKIIFFDLGGTLVTQNIENNIVTTKALKEISKLLPVEVSPRKLGQLYVAEYLVNQKIRSRHHVEIPIETWMYRLLWKAIGNEPSETLCRKAIKIVVKARAANTVTFPDSAKVLKQLARAHVKMAAISNVSSHEVALAILRHANLKQYLPHVITSTITGIRKPDPGIFRAALSIFKAKPSDAVIVGDSEHHDIEGGRISGWKTVLIDRNDETPHSIADYRFKSLEEALPILQSL